MKRLYFLAVLFLYTLISRFWHIDSLPTVSSDTVLVGRFITAFASCATTVVLYRFVRSYGASTRIALLCVWVFSVAPWAIEQGRIFSPVAIFTPVLLFSLWMMQLLHFPILIILRSISIFLLVGVFYLFLWEYQKDTGITSIFLAFRNMFALFSPTMFFISNTTFWWGGVKEFGMLFLSFAPFFFSGFLRVIQQRQWRVLVYVIVFGIVASATPLFPEGRQFYPALPFLCYITAVGLNRLSFRTARIFQAAVCVFLLIWIYENMQFWHYYVTHYPIQVRSSLEKITVPF